MSSWSFLPVCDLDYIHISCSDDQHGSEMLKLFLLLRGGENDAVI